MGTNENIFRLYESVLLTSEISPYDDIVVETYDDGHLFRDTSRTWMPVQPNPKIFLMLVLPPQIKAFLKKFENGITVLRPPIKKGNKPVASRVWLKMRGDENDAVHQDHLRHGEIGTESQYVKATVSQNEFGGSRMVPGTNQRWDGINLFRASLHMPNTDKDNSTCNLCFMVSDESVAYMNRYGEDLLIKTGNDEYVEAALRSTVTDQTKEFIHKRRKIGDFSGCSNLIESNGEMIILAILPFANIPKWTYDEFVNGSIWRNPTDNTYRVFPKQFDRSL